MYYLYKTFVVPLKNYKIVSLDISRIMHLDFSRIIHTCDFFLKFLLNSFFE